MRKIVYTDGIGTTLDPNRQVVLSTKMVAVHKKKPGPTIRLLLDIVRGGRPVDAITAGATAVALEVGRVEALAYIDLEFDELDEVPKDGKATLRSQMIRRLEELVSRIEKKK